MDDDNIIDWSQQRYLNWNDFMAESNPAVYQDAYSKIQYHPIWTLNSEQMRGDVFFFIDEIHLTTQFLKHLSWVRGNLANDILLSHQQGFFDLAEELRPRITRLLYEKFAKKQYPMKGKNETESKQFAREDSGILIKTELENLYNKLFLTATEKYETDTNYGENVEKQKEYDQRFKKLRE